MQREPLLSSEILQMLVSSVTNQGQKNISELEAERLLNAIARVQAGVPTGVNSQVDDAKSQN